MAKLAQEAVEKADIEQYLRTNSDFAFEVAVLSTLNKTGLECWHSGTYEDPISRKAREFDIQARSKHRPDAYHATVRLGIECKNLRQNYPLIIHRVPRALADAFTDVVRSSNEGISLRWWKYRYGRCVRLNAKNSLYVPGEQVGKSSDQIGKRPDGELVAGDQDVFDRISQALQSSHALLRLAHNAALKKPPVFTVVIPMLVVPDDRLWTIDYDNDGNVVAGPARARHASYFVDRRFRMGHEGLELTAWYSLSHLEICELSYLPTRVAELLSDQRLKIESIVSAGSIDE